MGEPRIFADPGLQVQFEQLGYCVTTVLSQADLERLEAGYSRFTGAGDGGFHATMYSSSVSHRRAVYDFITALAAERLRSVVYAHDIVVANWLVKESGTADSSVGFHQDWSFVDERHHRSVHVWIPLIDVGAHNGCLEVVGGSHRVARDHRGHGDRCRFQDLGPVLRADYATLVPLRAGAAVFYDGALLHWSGHNHSVSRRTAIGIVLSPVGVQVVHCHRIAPDTVEVYAVTCDFFWRHQPGSRPQGARLLGVEPAPTNQHGAAVLPLLERSSIAHGHP